MIYSMPTDQMIRLNSNIFQVQQEQSITERSRLEQRLEDLECKARALGQERVDLQVINQKGLREFDFSVFCPSEFSSVKKLIV